MVRDTARGYAQDKLFPRVLLDNREERFDPAIVKEMGALGLLGPTIPEEYGGAGLGYVAYGLITREIERVDSGYRSAMSVQSSLVMHPIFKFGSEAQRRKYLPKLATGEIVGCFGLTEPDHGSDPGSMATRAERAPGATASRQQDVDHHLPVADVALVWAKLDGAIRGFLVERGTTGFSTPKIEETVAARLHHRQIVLDDAFVPRESLLPHAKDLPVLSAAQWARGIAWARSAPPSSAGTGRANTCSIASSSDGRSPPTSSCRRSSRTCRPRSRSACMQRCVLAASSSRASRAPPYHC
jgi:glutaryl-CoA dehydrogenase